METWIAGVGPLCPGVREQAVADNRIAGVNAVNAVTRRTFLAQMKCGLAESLIFSVQFPFGRDDFPVDLPISGLGSMYPG